MKHKMEPHCKEIVGKLYETQIFYFFLLMNGYASKVNYSGITYLFVLTYFYFFMFMYYS